MLLWSYIIYSLSSFWVAYYITSCLVWFRFANLLHFNSLHFASFFHLMIKINKQTFEFLSANSVTMWGEVQSWRICSDCGGGERSTKVFLPLYFTVLFQPIHRKCKSAVRCREENNADTKVTSRFLGYCSLWIAQGVACSRSLWSCWRQWRHRQMACVMYGLPLSLCWWLYLTFGWEDLTFGWEDLAHSSVISFLSQSSSQFCHRYSSAGFTHRTF